MRRRPEPALALALIVLSACKEAREGPPAAATRVSSPSSPASAISGPPGQWAATPPPSDPPVWTKGCAGKRAGEQLACLEFVAQDWPRLGRYAAANREVVPPRPGEARVVLMGDSITDFWSLAPAGFFPGKPYYNRGIS